MKLERAATLVALVSISLFACNIGLGQNVVRIEEDWSLQVIAPDQQLDSPQITTALLPLGPNSSTHLFVDLNHGSFPDYSAGGLQLRFDVNGSTVDNKRILSGQKLQHNSEIIKWTQVIQQQGGQLRFGVFAGQSQSWGYFGGVDSLIEHPLGTGSLDAYRPADSLANSGAVYAGNRVANLTLLRVRLFNSAGQMVEIPINQSPL